MQSRRKLWPTDAPSLAQESERKRLGDGGATEGRCDALLLRSLLLGRHGVSTALRLGAIGYRMPNCHPSAISLQVEDARSLLLMPKAGRPPGTRTATEHGTVRAFGFPLFAPFSRRTAER